MDRAFARQNAEDENMRLNQAINPAGVSQQASGGGFLEKLISVLSGSNNPVVGLSQEVLSQPAPPITPVPVNNNDIVNRLLKADISPEYKSTLIGNLSRFGQYNQNPATVKLFDKNSGIAVGEAQLSELPSILSTNKNFTLEPNESVKTMVYDSSTGKQKLIKLSPDDDVPDGFETSDMMNLRRKQSDTAYTRAAKAAELALKLRDSKLKERDITSRQLIESKKLGVKRQELKTSAHGLAVYEIENEDGTKEIGYAPVGGLKIRVGQKVRFKGLGKSEDSADKIRMQMN